MVEGNQGLKKTVWGMEKKEAFCALAMLLIMVVIGILWPPYFYLNDDIAMRSILSGAYTGIPDGHAVYMKYPLTGVLAFCYFLMPQIPWMDLFFAGCIWICMCLFANRFPDQWMGGFLAIVVFLPFYLSMHYTIVAALVAAVAVFCLCDRKRRWSPPVLLWTAYMIRGQVGLLALPFVFAAYVWKGLQTQKTERKQLFKEQCKQCVILIAGMVVISCIHYICYSGQNWQDYLDYNKARTHLYDYTDFLSTDRYQKDYASYGMTKEESELLSSYNTMLAQQPDADRVQEITDVVTNQVNKEETRNPGNILSKYYLEIRYHNAPYNYLWMVLYGVLAWSMLFNKKWLQLAFLGILAIGRSSIWMYLLAQGRFPERVALSLYVIELLLLMAILLDTRILFQKAKLQFLSQLVLGLCFVLAGGCFFMTIPQKSSERMEVQLGWELLKAHAEENSDKTYLLDVFSVVSYADGVYEEDAENLLIMGGWMTGSPLAKERMEQLGGADAAEVLYYNRDARLVVEQDKDITWLESYLQKRFGDCSLVLTNQIVWEDGGFLVFKVQTEVARKETM